MAAAGGIGSNAKCLLKTEVHNSVAFVAVCVSVNAERI